jgi:Flp pilus assembly pilin Flp
MELMKVFLADERGQDLIEYTLLMAFLVIASSAIFRNAGGSVKTVWGVASNQLVNAATAAS